VIHTETCVEAAVRMAAGLLAIGLGHLGGVFVGSLFPGVGGIFYAISILPFGVAGLYAVATGLWVVVEGATGQSLERHAASMAAARATAASGPGDDEAGDDEAGDQRPDDSS
jgi:hypothetical protein